MVIGFVLDDTLDKPDGVQQYVLTLGKWMARQGHEVHYLVAETTRDDLNNVHTLAKYLNFTFNGNGVRTPLPANKHQVLKLLESLNLDVLHVQLPFSPFMAGSIIRNSRSSTAIIGTFHIMPYSWLSNVATRCLRMLTWRSLIRFDEILSVSKPAQQFANNSLGIQSKIIPNPIDMSEYKKISFKKNTNKIKIVFLGRLVERKGCMHLLKAINKLTVSFPSLELDVTIGGTGPLSSKLKSYVTKHSLNKTVKFIGFVDEKSKPEFLANSDLAVFPSLAGESFGIVLLEAMAAKNTVVIAGNNPGYSSVLTRKSQLVDPTNIQDFAITLQKFIFSEKERKQALIWQNNRIKQYSIDQVGDQLINIYNKALQTKHDLS